MSIKKKQRHSPFGRFLILLGIILLVAAAGLILYNRWDSKRAGASSAQVLDTLTAKLTTDTQTETSTDNEKIESEKSESSKIKSEEIESDGTPVTSIDNHAYMGIIEIPSIGIQLPIMYDWSYDNLSISVCRYTGSVYSDNLVICGHNYSSHFGGLSALAPGTDVYITTIDSQVFHYIVETTEVIEPTHVDTMIDSGYDLTLFTCTLSGQARVTVRCTKM